MPTPPPSLSGIEPTLYYDRVKEATSTTGTGTLTLDGADTGYVTFGVIGDGNKAAYCIADQASNDWEVGIGTYTLATFELSRDVVLASTNSNALVSFGAGLKDVFLTQPAALINGNPYAFYDYFASVGSVGTTETDIFSSTTPANTFLVDGDKLIARYGLQLVNSASTKRIRVYFAGTVLLDTGTMTVGASSTSIFVDAVLIRDSSTSIRYMVQASATGTNLFTSVGLLGTLTLTGTNILKVTGKADGGASANDDIFGIMGSVVRTPAA